MGQEAVRRLLLFRSAAARRHDKHRSHRQDYHVSHIHSPYRLCQLYRIPAAFQAQNRPNVERRMSNAIVSGRACAALYLSLIINAPQAAPLNIIHLTSRGKVRRIYSSIYRRSAMKKNSKRYVFSCMTIFLFVLALSAIHIAFADEEKNAEYFYSQGLIKARAGDLDGAIKDFTKAIQLEPKHVNAYFSRGVTRKMKGDPEGAIEDYDKALMLDPKNAKFICSRANARKATGDLDGAIADYDKSIRLDPKNLSAYLNRGNAKADKGDFRGAILDYTRSIILDPGKEIAYYNRANAWEEIGELDMAIADHDKAIELNPAFVKAHNNRGLAKSKKDDFSGAIADFDKAIELDAKYAPPYSNRGLLRMLSMMFKKAGEDFREVMKLRGSGHSTYPYAALYICTIEARTGNISAAVKEAKDCLAKVESDSWPKPILNFFAGTIKEEELLKAAESKKAPRRCEAYFYAAEARLAKGEKEAAVELFKKCIATGATRQTQHLAAKHEIKLAKSKDIK
ncbi:MAG: tetratricopeptide repeat protein [Planctomycetota bacterium]|nr:MAG: tetratricopeptide repeat protein [Planctomycetota bacterium]